MSSGLSDIAPAFGYIVGKGLLSRARDLHVADAGGNVAIVMVGSPFSLRFERDNGQTFVHAGNNSVGWHRLEHVLEFVDTGLPQAPDDELPAPELLAQWLESRWDSVTRLFRDRQRIAALESFSLRRSVTLLQQYFLRPL
jgi:hypothetical protein